MRHAMLLTAVVLLCSVGTGAAFGATVYPDRVLMTTTFAADGAMTPGDRFDPDNALGPADGEFFSLGLGGGIVLGFDEVVAAGKIRAFEMTFNRASYYEETADVYVSATEAGPFVLVGTVGNMGPNGLTVIDLRGVYSGAIKRIMLMDTTVVPQGRVGDGYDLDSLGIQSVPTPAAVSGLGLLGVLGVGRLVRRKNI